MNEVISFYDEHPINEGEILAKLEQAGKDLAHLKPEDLQAYDQDHYGGTAATDILAHRLALKPEMRVLDICSGMGGTSRYLAQRHGCEVVGVDFTESRVRGAEKLTALVNLQERVTYVLGDASTMEFAPESFDAAVGQEAFVHIPDKAGLMASSHRVLKPGAGLAFTDLIAHAKLTDADRERIEEVMHFNNIASQEQYRELLEGAGFRDVTNEDLSAEWRVILLDRLEMFKSLEAETVRIFGPERHHTFIEAYTFFLHLIDTGSMGGARFHAVKG